MDYIVLSPEDARLIQQMIKWWKVQPPIQQQPAPQILDSQAVDIYLAKVPSGGIPAFTVGSGSGTDEDDVTGTVCDIYKIVSTGTEQMFEIVSAEFDKTVFNIGATSILTTDARYVVIWREFGRWITYLPNSPRSLLAYAAKNTSSSDNPWLESSGLFGNRYVIPLNTQIHKFPTGTTSISLNPTYSEITVSANGLYAFSGYADAHHDAQGPGEQLTYWLAEASPGTYDADAVWEEVFGTTMHLGLLNAQREEDSRMFYVEHYLSTPKKYRMEIDGGYAGDPSILNEFHSRLNIRQLFTI